MCGLIGFWQTEPAPREELSALATRMAERAVAGQPLSAATLRKAADVAMSGAKGYEHNQFKIELAKRTILRAFSELSDA